MIRSHTSLGFFVEPRGLSGYKFAVLAFPVTRWLLVHLLHSTLAWLLFAAIFCLWPVLAVLSPLGVSTASTPAPDATWAAGIGFLALLAAHALAVSGLSSVRTLLVREPGRRLAAETVALTVSASFFLGPALAWGFVLGPGLPELLALAPALLMAHIHMMGLSLVLLRLPLPPSLASAGLLMGAWFLPALLPASPLFRSLAFGPYLAHGTSMTTGHPTAHLCLLSLWVMALALLHSQRAGPP